MSVCHNCQRKTVGCHAHCEDHIVESLFRDLIHMGQRKKRIEEERAKGVGIRRWEKNNHRRTRQM